MYSEETEVAERDLFQEIQSLKNELTQNMKESNDILVLFVTSNLKSPYDLHGRRRLKVILEHYQVRDYTYN